MRLNVCVIYCFFVIFDSRQSVKRKYQNPINQNLEKNPRNSLILTLNFHWLVVNLMEFDLFFYETPSKIMKIFLIFIKYQEIFQQKLISIN